MTIALPYLKDFRDRHGRRRIYFRRKGYKATPLPDPGPEPAPSAEFMTAYRACLAQGPADPVARFKPGSFGTLVTEYYGSAEFKNMKASSQTQARRILDKLREEHGDKPVALMQRRHIRKLRDKLADRPGAAMNLVRWMRRVLAFAVENETIASNPAARLKGFKLGEWRAWSDAELDAYRKRWPAGTMQRRAFVLALYTGQRCADLAGMTRADRSSGFIDVAQEKTGEKLTIEEHPALAAELDGFPSKHMVLLHNAWGKPFTASYLSQWFAAAIEAAGLPKECVLHGLRKTAARMLAEAGCTDREIMAVTGHRTTAMVSHYTKHADQKRRASAAIHKLQNAR